MEMWSSFTQSKKNEVKQPQESGPNDIVLCSNVDPGFELSDCVFTKPETVQEEQRDEALRAEGLELRCCENWEVLGVEGLSEAGDGGKELSVG